MAKFFLFIFTILLSLSLGLFVGQNYLLNEKPISPQTAQDQSPKNPLGFDLKDAFKKFKDKIFANEEVVPLSKEEKMEQDLAFVQEEEEKTEPESTSQIPDTNSTKKEPGLDSQKSSKSDSSRSTIDAPQWPDGSTVEGWVIQIAAFQTTKEAQKAEEQVKNAGFPHFTYKTKINGQTWYRINVGPFDTVAEATNFKQSQKVHLKFKGAFVRKI